MSDDEFGPPAPAVQHLPVRPKGMVRTHAGWAKFGGRKKGTLNKTTVEAKAAARAIVDDPKYRKKLLARARAGTIPPAVETMLWYYARGKPRETITLESDVRISTETRVVDAMHMDYDQLKAATALLRASNNQVAELLGLPPVAEVTEPHPDDVEGQVLEPEEDDEEDDDDPE